MDFKIENPAIRTLGSNAWSVTFQVKSNILQLYLAKDLKNKWAIFNAEHYHSKESSNCPVCGEKIEFLSSGFCSKNNREILQKQIENVIRIRFIAMGEPINFPLGKR